MFRRRISGLLAYSLISCDASTGRSFKLANHSDLNFSMPHATAREGGKCPGSIHPVRGATIFFSHCRGHCQSGICCRGIISYQYLSLIPNRHAEDSSGHSFFRLKGVLISFFFPIYKIVRSQTYEQQCRQPPPPLPRHSPSRLKPCFDTTSEALTGHDEEQIRLMDEVCIVTDENDLPIGTASKKICTKHPTLFPLELWNGGQDHGSSVG
jgi:hypothetical protein